MILLFRHTIGWCALAPCLQSTVFHSLIIFTKIRIYVCQSNIEKLECSLSTQFLLKLNYTLPARTEPLFYTVFAILGFCCYSCYLSALVTQFSRHFTNNYFAFN